MEIGVTDEVGARADAADDEAGGEVGAERRRVGRLCQPGQRVPDVVGGRGERVFRGQAVGRGDDDGAEGGGDGFGVGGDHARIAEAETAAVEQDEKRAAGGGGGGRFVDPDAGCAAVAHG